MDGACIVKVNFGENEFVWQDTKKQKVNDIEPRKSQNSGTYRSAAKGAPRTRDIRGVVEGKRSFGVVTGRSFR